MAKADPDAPQGLEIEMHDRWTKFTGSKQDLVSEGVVSDAHFPAPPKRIKHTRGPDKGGSYGLVDTLN